MKKFLISILFFLLCYWFCFSSSPLPITDDLTQQILKLQLLEMNYQTLEKKSSGQEQQLKLLEQSNKNLQMGLEKATESSVRLSKDLNLLEMKCKSLKVSLIVITPITVATTITTIILIMEGSK